MAAIWELWLNSAEGYRIGLLPGWMNLSIVQVVNGAGSVRVDFPGTVKTDLFRVDRVVELYRRAEGVTQLWTMRVRHVRRAQTEDGVETVSVIGPDANELVGRRIVAYAAGTSQASKSGAADDLMKAVVRENLGASATAARQMPNFTVAADEGLGPTITKAFAYRLVDRVLDELADAADEAGTPVFWWVETTTETGLSYMFRTGVGQPGQDVSDGVVFGAELGNLTAPELDEDYQDEATVVYAGGRGEGATRTVVEVEDTERSGASAYNRIEYFVDGREQETTAGLTDKAEGALAKMRPVRRISGRLLNSGAAVFGRDWRFGDRVGLRYGDVVYSGLVQTLTVGVQQSGQESIDARVEVEA